MNSVNYLLFVILLSTLSVVSVLPKLESVWADSLIATLEVGQTPLGIQYNPSNDDIYVGNRDSDSVSVIDSSTNTVIDTIQVGDSPRDYSPIFNPSNNDMYVANKHSHDVSVIDSSTNTVIDPISVGLSPYYLEYNPSNNDIYVANSNSNTVSVISTTVSSQPEIIESIQHLINSIIKNPLDVTNSIDSANEIRDILTDNNRDNDQIVCSLINGLNNEQIMNIRNILNC
jgi:YVTN family beta-propeller protein